MASPSSKRKPKLEPISIAELEGDPTMVGFTSLFRIPTTGQPLPHMVPSNPETTVGSEVDRTETPDPTAGDGPKPTKGVGPQPTVEDASTTTVGVGSSPSVGGQYHTPSPFFSADDGKLYPHQRVRPLREPHDVLSPVEFRALETLERLAEPNRRVRIGYDRLAEACSLNEKSVRMLLLRLIEKGFLSIVAPADPERQLGKEYRLHSVDETKHYHHEKGWQWVVRSGNGVLVVRPV